MSDKSGPLPRAEGWDLRLGSCLDPASGLASLQDKSVDHVITDPVWPNRPPTLWPEIDAVELWASVCPHLARVARRRITVILGVDTDPRFLASVPASFPFVRVCWLRYALSSYNGTILNGGVVAYVFGDSKGPHGATLLPGEKTASTNGVPPGVTKGHPCPRKDEHLDWLVRFFTNPGETIVDPFAGSATTGTAAVRQGRSFIGWEIDPKYHAFAQRQLSKTREQKELAL